MNENILLVIFAVIVLLIAVGIWMTINKRRTDHLRDRFGDEYDRTLDNAGNRTKAERDLERREERVDALAIRRLTADEHTRFATEWRDVKAVFVDSPVEAVLHADRMLATMMKTVGYPMADFDRRYEDLTVNHGDVARHYREGHAIVDRHNDGSASTEDMRQGMKHYEALFDHLVADAEGGGLDATTTGTTTTGTTTGSTTRATDIDGDGDADVVRQDTDGDGRADRVAIRND